MPRRGFCASCGREVWVGRDGGCQFGHPATEMTDVHDADAPPAASTPFAQPPLGNASPPPPAPPPAVPAAAAGVAGAAAAAVPLPDPEPAPETWGRTPDDVEGKGAYSFDYMSLTPDVSIGDTDCLLRRVFARILDNMLLVSVTLAFMTPMILAAFAAIQERRTVSFGAGPYVLSFGLELAYFVLLPLVWPGRTLGKALLGIAITDLHGRPPSLLKLLVRELTMIVPIDMFLSGIVGLVYASKNDRTQRIGDVWAETVVVRTR